MKQRLKNIRPPATPRLSMTLTLTILVGCLAALTVAVSNLASTTIPDMLKLYVSYSWLALGVLLLLGIIVATWQVWYMSGQSTNNGPSSAPMPQIVAQGTGNASTFAPASVSPTQSIPRPSTLQPTTQPLAGSSSSQSTSSAPIPASSAALVPTSGSSHYHTCVISYSTDDQQFVNKLYADLKAHGVPCWLADQDVKLGDKLRAEIYQAIGQLDKLLLVLSKNAIESLWVEEEVDVALDREHQQPGNFLLFPLRLDDTVLATSKYWAITVRQRRIGNFCYWQQDAEYQQALQRVLRDLHV